MNGDPLDQWRNDPWYKWQHAFLAEWCELAEGRADPHQVLDVAGELYKSRWDQEPVQVARDQFDAGQ